MVIAMYAWIDGLVERAEFSYSCWKDNIISAQAVCYSTHISSEIRNRSVKKCINRDNQRSTWPYRRREQPTPRPTPSDPVELKHQTSY